MLNAGKVVMPVALCLALVAPVSADFSSVSAPFPGELGHGDILSGIYGGSFTLDGNGVDWSNGAITATRIDDKGLGGIMNIVNGTPGAADDQVFDDGFIEAHASAKYTILPNQSFGFFGGASGGSYNKLFDVSGYGFATTGSMSMVDASGSTWRFAHQRGAHTHSSRAADNFLGIDWMVSYQITGLDDGWTTWALFWEDAFGGIGDYNDVVVEVRATAKPIPTPTATMLGVLGLGAIACLRRRVA